MKYIKKHYAYLLCLLFLFLAFNLYFIFLLPTNDINLLLYLDLLLIVCIGLFFVVDSYSFYTKEKQKAEYLEMNDFICTEMKDLEDQDIIEHDFTIFEQKLNEQISINQNLQDFITKWCHEVKIPLSTALLMDEKIEDPILKMQLKEQLEKIKQYLNSALVSCKVQGSFDNLHITKLSLKECIHTSIKNNRYFLIQRHADLHIHVDDEYVYSDKEWLVYIIDQILINAIKYAKEHPEIHIWTKHNQNQLCLYIKDFGEGMKDFDIPRIFEKGYIGSNHHNGQYKSTGMGLYMVNLMIKKLGHEITVESCYQEYTCFCIIFKNIEAYFNL